MTTLSKYSCLAIAFYVTLAAPGILKAQDCGTLLIEQDRKDLLRQTAAGMYQLAAVPHSLTNVPLTFHVVRMSSGIGGLTATRLCQAISDLNSSFLGAEIRFYLAGPIDYIDSDNYFFNIDTLAEINALRSTNAVSNSINVYFTENLADEEGGLCGISSFTVNSVQGIVMKNDCTATQGDHATLAHEVGHYFDLYHTHETAFGAECVDGSNCTSAGDQLCDTPADPELGETNVDATCTYVGSETDSCNGDTYHPDPANLMSYSPSQCANIFTNNQNARARATLTNLRPELLHASIPLSADCNVNSVSDFCDIANGTSQDLNSDAIPDECETDLIPPTVTVTSPTSAPTYATSNSTMNLGGSSSDNVAVSQVVWTNNLGGSGTADGTTSWSITNIALQPGTNVLTVTAHDAAGNTAQDVLSVTQSSGCSQSPSPPTVVTASAPPDGTWYCDHISVVWPQVQSATTYQVFRNSTNDSASAQPIHTTSATSWDDYSVVQEAFYYYWVKACNTCGCSGFNATPGHGARGIPPAAPNGVQASDAACDRVSVSWNLILESTNYSIWRSAANNSATAQQIATAAYPPFQDLTTVSGATYYYWVRAIASCGTSDFSNSDAGHSGGPPAPTGVVASDGLSGNCGVIRITWNAVPNATQYRVYRSASNDPSSAQPILGYISNQTTADDITSDGGWYWYWVTACSGDTCCSSLSSSDRGYKGGPPAPENASASTGSFCDRVRVSWNAVPGGTSTRYWVYRDGTSIGSNLSATTFDDLAASASALHAYTVGGTNSCQSFPVSFCNPVQGFSGLPPAPTGVMASDGTVCGAVRVNWTVVPGVTQYTIWRSTANDTSTATQLDTASGPPLDLITNSPAVHYFWVRAVSTCGSSSLGTGDSGFGGAPPIAAPIGAVPSNGATCLTQGVCLAWQPVSNAATYDVYWGVLNPPPLWGSVTGTIACPPHQAGTTCRWYVVARNNCGTGPAGAQQSYSIVGSSPDCNGNGVNDICDINSAFATDCNSNGIPDSCEPPITMVAFVNVLLEVNNNPVDLCLADQNRDGLEDGQDVQLYVRRLIGG